MCEKFFRRFADSSLYDGGMPASKEQLDRALGREIHAAYVREGMTAAEVADKAGFSEATMTRILAGSGAPMSRIYMIASAIGVPVLEMVEAAVRRAEKE